ncbi:hypothetical protein IEQ34_013496 [Dendrobium chrysotoxum]|uniref:Uncharacterized protein n=1 Tax=Dendrobium chrysotoxum TaxID=161865 RepID=A0AAV7GPW5_DENCH|nr:hypothetical protein IEQ34_013496 [Dendrobium chrysotoxum]
MQALESLLLPTHKTTGRRRDCYLCNRGMARQLEDGRHPELESRNCCSAKRGRMGSWGSGLGMAGGRSQESKGSYQLELDQSEQSSAWLQCANRMEEAIEALVRPGRLGGGIRGLSPDDFLPQTATPLEDVFKSLFWLEEAY